ncbi:hypothetical protein DL96DRAFT_1685815 [Flagelloscypha sp. PMI_526]|nr:hypothetical protein DL96DRAFT_1685815 [Flagelloscypha sp. PMI_526]
MLTVFYLLTLAACLYAKSQATTNGKRLAQGLPPGFPRQLYSSRSDSARRGVPSAATVPSNLVVNGDFEIIASPWHPSKDGVSQIQNGPPYGHDESRGFVELYAFNTTKIGTLTQTISGFTAGSIYTLSYWLSIGPSDGPECTLTVSVGDSVVEVVDATAGDNLFYLHLDSFQALTTEEVLSYVYTCTPPYYGLVTMDDVSIVEEV